MEALVSASLEDELETRNSTILFVMTQNYGQAPTIGQVYAYFAPQQGVGVHGYYSSGMPPMYSVLPDYTLLAVVDLNTGELLGQMDNMADLDVAEALTWVDAANQ